MFIELLLSRMLLFYLLMIYVVVKYGVLKSLFKLFTNRYSYISRFDPYINCLSI